MKPKIQKRERKNEKPILVFAQDVSESIKASKKGEFYSSSYMDSIKNYLSKLEEAYDVRTFIFGDEILENTSFIFDHTQSNLDQLFKHIENQFNAANITDVIVASDGIFNTGIVNPSLENLDIKVHSLLLGDTNTNPDVLIQNIKSNSYAVLNNQFPLEILVKSNVDVSNLFLILKEKNEIIESRNVNVKKGINRFNFNCLAKTKGIHQFDIAIKGLANELNLINNSSSVIIDVLDYNQNILLISSCPHPDISAIKGSISKLQGTKIKSVLIKDFNQRIDDFNLICFFKPFKSVKMVKLMDKCISLGIPTFTFTGNNLDKEKVYFSKIAINKETKFKGSNLVDVYLSDDFDAFKLDKTWFSIFSSLPPLSIPFSANYSIHKNAFSVLKQSVNGVNLQYPVIYFHKTNETCHAVLLGEGIWKWNMHQHQKGVSSNEVDGFLQKIFQYLKKIDPKKRLKINVPKMAVEDESLLISAEFYNDNYELSNSGDLIFTYRDSLGNEFEKKLIRTEDVYQLSLSNLSPGNYTFDADLKYSEQIFNERGSFKIIKSKKEWNNLCANHNSLKSIAGPSNSYFLADFDLLNNKLLENSSKKIKIHESVENTDLIDYKWILFIFLILPFTEWIIRKYNGLV